MSEIIAQGAEAVIRKDGGAIVKDRVGKGYRIKEIDSALRKKRTKLEARLIREARRSGVMTPQVVEENEFSIKMDFVSGKRLKEFVNGRNFRTVAKRVGSAVALLHNYNIIHGDLTTSNMIVNKGKSDGVSPQQRKESTDNFSIYFIDFGLGFFSQRAEDKATDLHVLKEAITATHFDIAERFWAAVLDAYVRNYEGNGKVIKALSKIEKRGRYQKER
jgi:Kae1-associated kinase Bud32